MDELLTTILSLTIGFLLCIAILVKPYLGLVFTLAMQPIIDLIPSVPFVSSVSVIIGLVTLLAIIIKGRNENFRFAFRFSAPHLLTALFIFWIFASNPTASWFGADRNWFFTYTQLLILLWLSGILLDTPQKHRVLMWAFSVLTFITAIVAISQGGFLEEIDPEVRAAGLTQGANTAARYFVVTFVFLNYLRSVTKSNFWRSFTVLGMIITFLGVFYTVSRSGMLLLMVAIVLMIMLQSSAKLRLRLIMITFIGITLLLVFSGSVFVFLETIAPSITEGTDTVGLRYALWEAGWEMWKDHPLSGVGIGMFKYVLRNYPNPQYASIFQTGIVAHNMYVSILSETGIIGFVLFIGLLIAVLINLIGKKNKISPDLKSISNVWLIIYVVMLLGGLTKTDQVEKLLWLTMGVSVFFHNQVRFSRKVPKSATTPDGNLPALFPERKSIQPVHDRF